MSLLAPSAADFPVLPHTGVAYLDSGATSQTPIPVIEAMDAYYREYRASVHRGVYPIAALATEAYEGARAKVAAFAGSAPGETVFTRNATEAINLVAYSWGSANVRAGDLVVVTEMEHHSNIVPWQMLCERTGAELAYVPIDDEGLLVDAELDALLERGPKLLAVAHVSNVLGTVNPIAEIVARAPRRRRGRAGRRRAGRAAPAARRARARRRLLRLDRAQGLRPDRARRAARPPRAARGDAAVPRRRAHDRQGREVREPLRGAADEVRGGDVADRRGGRARRRRRLPLGFGMAAVWEHSRDVVGYAVERLGAIDGLEIHGPSDLARRGSVISFALDGVHPHDVAEILGREGVCVRAGHHCAQVLMGRLGVAATTRASFAVHSTHDDVDRLVAGLGTVQEIFS